jgi:hypothetical protein
MSDDQSKTNQASAGPGETPPQATTPPTEDPDSRRVRIVRADREDGPATCISYEDGSGSLKQWHPELEVKLFEVPAIIAVEAIRSGFFKEAANTKTRLKAVAVQPPASSEATKEN